MTCSSRLIVFHKSIFIGICRSEARLQKLGSQLISDTSKHANEEDSSIDILSDGEPTGNHVVSPKNGQQIKASPSKKRAHSNLDAAEGSKPGLLKLTYFVY